MLLSDRCFPTTRSEGVDVQITLSTVVKEFHCLAATKVRTHLKYGELGKVGMATTIRRLPRAPMPERNKRALIKSDQDQENALEQEQDGPVK